MVLGVVNVHGSSLQHPEDCGQHVTFYKLDTEGSG